MNERKEEFWQGVKTEIPIVFGVIPFGLVFGVLAANTGITPWLAWSTSQIVFAGSAQFLAIPLIQEGAPAAIMVLTTVMINLRHLLYSAALAPYSRNLSMGWKVLLSYLLTDEAFAPTIVHFQDAGRRSKSKHWFWLGAGLTLWISWQISTGAGIFLGARLPQGLGLEFTLSLTFIGLIVPMLTSRPAIGSAVSAGIVAVLTNGLPFKLNLMIAALVGIATGLLLESRLRLKRRALPWSST